MATIPNPFKATLGATPPLLVGREEVIDNFALALDEGPGAHERVSFIVGPRGIGKTVLLNAFEDEARSRGWFVLQETATSGFTERLRQSIIRELAKNRSRISGLNLTLLGIGGGINWDVTTLSDSLYSLRVALEDYLEYKAELDRQSGQESSGLLITVDELHHQRSSELVEFGATIQHLIREEREIAVAMAGIPASVTPLLSGKDGAQINPATFLRRAERIILGSVRDSDVRQALEKPLVGTGVVWEAEALDAAVEACRGYPFMIQLVGQQAFRAREGSAITACCATRGIGVAQRKLGQLVHEPALKDLSDVDRTFLVYMAQDDEPSLISDIKNRMGRSDSYVSNYRRRLIDAEMIVEVGRGRVDFALPYLRDYLREHATALVVASEV